MFRKCICAVRDDVLLRVRNIEAGYGRSRVLFGVDLEVPSRGAIAILGRNGAGKTTLLKTIIGEIASTGGRIEWQGRDISRLATERRVRQGLGYVPQEHAVFSRLSVRDNLAIGALGGDRDGIERVLSIFPKLGQRLDQAAGTLSGGERKILAIARAVLLSPKLLLLDEPTEGVWIGVIDEIAERLAELATEIAIVIVEQHLELALGIAERAYVVDRGRVVVSGSSDEVRHDPRLLTYLAP